MRARITDGIVSSTTLLLVFILLIAGMVAACDSVKALNGPVNVLGTATGGTPTYADSLNNSNSAKTQAARWDMPDPLDLLGNKCKFGSDGYHVIQSAILLDSFSLHACHEDSYQYVNATIVVNVTILSGHSGGLFFRFNKDPSTNYSGYLFEIDSSRNYKFSIFTGNIANPQTILKDWTLSSALKAGYNVTNTLAVIMKGNTFNLFANDSPITTLTDSAKTYASGDVAFFASAANVNTEVVFSNLKVYQSS